MKYSREYLMQFTLDNLLKRKWSLDPDKWYAWLDSLTDTEIKYISTVLTFDKSVKAIIAKRYLYI